MIFTTHYFMPDGTKCSGPRINATGWKEAEYIASVKGVEVTGELCREVDENIGSIVDYDNLN